MGTVHKIRPAGAATTLDDAVRAYLVTLAFDEKASTRRTYEPYMRKLAARFGADAPVSDLEPAAVADWVTEMWGSRKPATWNVVLDALKSAGTYWTAQDWISDDLTRMLPRRTPAVDRDRALPRAEVEELLTRKGVALRDRLLWTMLYETAARSAEVLRLDVDELDMPNHCARVKRKGGTLDTIAWQTRTARLLPRYLRGRTSGPLFLTERRARIELPPGDIDPGSGRARLSYRQAEGVFKDASGGATLHQLRHSALTHAAEDGTNTFVLMARSGHENVRSLARYARVSREALLRHQAETDPARRKR